MYIRNTYKYNILRMDKINIDQNQFSDLINLTNGVFFPLKNFVSKVIINYNIFIYDFHI